MAEKQLYQGTRACAMKKDYEWTANEWLAKLMRETQHHMRAGAMPCYCTDEILWPILPFLLVAFTWSPAFGGVWKRGVHLDVSGDEEGIRVRLRRPLGGPLAWLTGRTLGEAMTKQEISLRAACFAVAGYNKQNAWSRAEEEVGEQIDRIAGGK
jgi:hypothetical protein